MLCGRKERPGCITGIYGKLHSIDCWRFSHSSSSPHFPLICRKPFSTRSTGSGNHYQVLGIQRYASQDEIKQAFYMLTKKYHPDVVGSSDGTNQKFLEIREAYETLRDEQKRHEYDRKLGGNDSTRTDRIQNKKTNRADARQNNQWRPPERPPFSGFSSTTTSQSYSPRPDEPPELADLYRIWRGMMQEHTSKYSQGRDDRESNWWAQYRRREQRQVMVDTFNALVQKHQMRLLTFSLLCLVYLFIKHNS